MEQANCLTGVELMRMRITRTIAMTALESPDRDPVNPFFRRRVILSVDERLPSGQSYCMGSQVSPGAND